MSELGAIMDQNAQLVDRLRELETAVGTLALCVALLGGGLLVVVWRAKGNSSV